MAPKLTTYTSSFVDHIRSSLEQKYGNGEVVLTKLLDQSGVIAVLPMRDDRTTNAQLEILGQDGD